MEVLTATCPECHSTRVYRDGLRYSVIGEPIQRFLCRECGFKFINGNSFKKCVTIPKRQICVSLQGAKNLISATETKTVAGNTETQKNNKREILEYLLHLHKLGLKPKTLEDYGYKLKKLEGNANLDDPESVKEFLADNKTWSLRTKHMAVAIYDGFLKWQNKTWQPPRYKPVKKLPFIPTENEIDQMIAASGKRTAPFLQLLKETGMRCGEAVQVEWAHIDFIRKTVHVTPEKGSNPRILPISDKLIGMIQRLPKKGNRVWTATLTSIKTNFFQRHKRIEAKPKIKKKSAFIP